MANKYDLKTWVRQSLVGPATQSALSNMCIGSNTAATGKTRFLTYIRVQRSAITLSTLTSLIVGISDATTSIPSGSTIFATGNQKLNFYFPSAVSAPAGNIAGMVQEIRGTIDHPIIAVAGGTYMGIGVGTGALGSSVGVFAEYYDE